MILLPFKMSGLTFNHVPPSTRVVRLPGKSPRHSFAGLGDDDVFDVVSFFEALCTNSPFFEDTAGALRVNILR